MEKRKVDVAVIGAGTAGLVAFGAAREHTDSVVLIEDGPGGTTCARVGCMPSKLLIAAADAAHGARHADLFGVHADNPRIDGAQVMARVRRERDRFVGSVIDSIERIPDGLRLCGHARFTGPRQLMVDDRIEIEADRIVIATGSRPHVVDFLKAAGDRLLVSDSLFELPDLPRSVAVFGPGVIGLELGQALSRLGVDIRMFGASGSVGSIRSDEIREYAQRCFNEEFYLDPAADVRHVARTDSGVAVTYVHRERGEITETFDYLLAATGRRPNLDRMDLEKSGLPLDDRGMPDVNRHTLQCGDSRIFLVGDASGGAKLLHEAADEGRIAGANAGRFPDIRPGLRRAALAVVFTDPQIATVGLTIGQMEAQHHRYAVGEVSFEDQGRSRVMGRNRGLLRVYGERDTGLFLGAEMFGPAAEHIGHLLAWAAQQRMTVSEMLEMPFYHPVIEEGVRTALWNLNDTLDLAPAPVERCMACGPGS